MKIIKKINSFLDLRKLSGRIITTIILVMTAGTTAWALAAFTEPTFGPADSNQDFAQNILGANNPDNAFDSSLVVASSTGSIIERLEYIDNSIGENTDLASISGSLFAGQKYIIENMASSTGQQYILENMSNTGMKYVGDVACDSSKEDLKYTVAR